MSDTQTYLKQAETQMKKWQADLERAKAAVAEKQYETKSEYYQQVMEASQKEKELQEKMAALKKAGQESWDELKHGFEQAAGELEKAVNKSLETMKSQEKG